MPTTLSPRARPVIKRALLITPGVPGLKFNRVLPTVTANIVPSNEALEGHELNPCKPCPCDTGIIDRLPRLKAINASETKTFAVLFELLKYIILLLMDFSYVSRIRVAGRAIHLT